MLTRVPASPVLLQLVFSPQLPRLRAPSEDRQGSRSPRNLPRRSIPLPNLPPELPSQDPVPILPKLRTHLQVQAQLSASLCCVPKGGGGEEAAAQLQPGEGKGQTTLSPVLTFLPPDRKLKMTPGAGRILQDFQALPSPPASASPPSAFPAG